MTNDRAAIHALLDELLDATERERAANSDEARSLAQETVINLHRELTEKAGVRNVKRRRTIAHAQGRMSSADVNDETFPDGRLDLDTVAGRRRARAMASMIIYDSDMLPAHQAHAVMGGLYAASKGLPSYIDVGDGDSTGVLFGAEAVMGRKETSAAEMFLKIIVVTAVGYEAGILRRPHTKRLVSSLLDEAARLLRNATRLHRLKEMTREFTPSTIRDWCTDTRSETREWFEQSYKRGQVDAAAGVEDPTSRLAALEWRIQNAAKTRK